jgi:hypothetical protein
VQSWSVDRIKRELDEKGLHTCGLKRDLVARLAAAMANGGEYEIGRRSGAWGMGHEIWARPAGL